MNISKLLLIVLLVYLPILINPNLFLGRDNDLNQFFWPMYQYVKQEIFINHQIPLWSNYMLSGTPLLPDPQSPLFYPPNLLFLFMPTSTAFLILVILHTAWGALGCYWCAKFSLRFTTIASIITGWVYVSSSRLGALLEAGHFGLICSLAWLPFTAWFTIKKPTTKSIILLSLSLAAIFYTHSPTFIIACVLVATTVVVNPKVILAFILTTILIAPGLIPQLKWLPQTTRSLLLQDRTVYPLWHSFREFVLATVHPVSVLDTEQWLPLGAVFVMFSFYGWLKLPRYKLMLIFLVSAIFLLAINNISPLYQFLLKQDWYVLLRVSTRPWIVLTVLVPFLVGFGTIGLRPIFKLLVILGIVESLVLSWQKSTSPIKAYSYAPESILKFIDQDKDLFRITCLSRCLDPKQIVLHRQQTLEGYATVMQLNYYSHARELFHFPYDYYTLAIPPMGSVFTKLQPSSKSLGEYNVKYIISPHVLDDLNFNLINKIDSYFIYKNNNWLPRAYFVDDKRRFVKKAKLISNMPNMIRIDLQNRPNNKLLLAEVFSPKWKALINSTKPVTIQSTPESLRYIDLPLDSNYVDFIYNF